MSIAFTASEAVLAIACFAAVRWTRPRSPEAAIGFSVMGLAAALGALLWTPLPGVESLYQVMVSAGRIWGLPMVGLGWLLVRVGEDGEAPPVRTAASMIAFFVASWLFGGAWRLVGGIGSLALMVYIAGQTNPNHPRVLHGRYGAILVLIAAGIGTEGTWLGLEAVSVFHGLLAGGCLLLASGLLGLPGAHEQL
jgi:hypothetical protein